MNPLTIILFLFVLWGLGHLLTRIVPLPTSIFERNFLRIGLGLGAFSVLAIFFNLLYIPLHWFIFLLVSIPSPLMSLIKKEFHKPNLQFNKENIYYMTIILLFFIHLSVFLQGAFAYPYLEDGDPLDHARSIRFIASEKTAFEPSPTLDGELFKFMDPYPPVYDVIMGILYQIDPTMIPLLKVINSLMISLIIIYFFIFCKKFLKDSDKALAATFILFLIPSFMSHFIWAVTLPLLLFFPTMYALESIKDDKRWMYISALMIAAILVSQPSTGLKICVMIFLYWLVKSIINFNINKHVIIAGIFGLLLSLLWWGPVFVRWGSPLEGDWPGVTFKLENQARADTFGHGLKVIGTADRIFTLPDFFFAPSQNMINNPIGLGGVLFFILIISVLYQTFTLKNNFSNRKEWIKDNEWKIIILIWLFFTFLGIHGARLPVQLIAFRFWMLFAIPVSVLAGATLIEIVKPKTVARVALISLVLVGVATTSGIPKYQINTSIWPPGDMWTSRGELFGYLETRSIFPVHEKIFTICPSGSFKTAALDYDECIWCSKELDIKQNFLNKSTSDIYNNLKTERYKYIILDRECLSAYDYDLFVSKVNEMGRSDLFRLEQSPFSELAIFSLR